MKKLVVTISAALVLASCANESARYTDLQTGKTIKPEKSASGETIDADTKKPVYLYVDHQTNDTINGKTGKTVNGQLTKTPSGELIYVGEVSEQGGELKIKSGDYKLKVDEDGDIKIKDGDTKTKIDGETGEKKTKKD